MKVFPKYKFKILQEVAWGDMDAFGHVNNVTYMKYFENARAKFFTHLSIWESNGISVKSGMVLSHIEMDYRKQVRFLKSLVVTISVQNITKKSFQVHCSMWNEFDECVVLSRAHFLWYDFVGHKVMSLPTSFLDTVTQFEAESV